MPSNNKLREPQPIWRQSANLFFMELANWGRQSWRRIVFVGTFASLHTLIALTIFARDNGTEALGYVLTGAVITSLFFGTMSFVQRRFIQMRVMGVLEYYATLPIWRYGLILAVVLTALLVSLPSLLIIILFGSRVLLIPIQPSLLIVLVLPLSTLPFAALGALIGTTSRTIDDSNSINTVLMLALTLLGPILSPPELLPNVIVTLGRFNPGTYAASALRQVLLGPITAQLLLDLIVLTGFTTLGFWLVRRFIGWQLD